MKSRVKLSSTRGESTFHAETLCLRSFQSTIYNVTNPVNAPENILFISKTFKLLRIILIISVFMFNVQSFYHFENISNPQKHISFIKSGLSTKCSTNIFLR